MVSYRYLGSGTTDSTGVAEHSYTGTGKGEIQVIASTDRPIGDGSLQSEIYELIDALFNGTGTLNGWYDGTSFTVTNATLEDNIVKWTVPSSNQYFGYRKNVSSDLKDATLKTTVKITSDRNVRLGCYAYTTSWSQVSSVVIPTGSDEITLTSIIPSDATIIWVRLQSNTSSDVLSQGDEVFIEKWVTYIG